ncbi:hypothetical protein LCGC14_3003380 [marine sediment metagenome]|uniref:HNH nuclease domain-containing protein n=1 Tax=marine sediment metagenome TaxID=412755 RepID=A0A0F8Z7Z9_9ZZZZ
MGKLIELSGKRFGRLKVIARAKSETGHGKHAHWKCVCNCGNMSVVRSNLLRTGNTQSCGCLVLAKDLTSQVFGKLRVLKRDGTNSTGEPLWKCKCSCGNITTPQGRLLKNGQSTSCGCNKKYNNLKHGLSGTSEYNRIALSKRKARKLANGGSHTAQEILDLFDKQKSRCYYCGKKLTDWHQDHKTPFSRGGTDNIDNIVISCPRCNLSKGSKTEEEFYTFHSDTKTPA